MAAWGQLAAQAKSEQPAGSRLNKDVIQSNFNLFKSRAEEERKLVRFYAISKLIW